MTPSIREETPDDFQAIRQVNLLAFGSGKEAELIDDLRSEGLVVASLVAVLDGQVAGHILFSELPVETRHSTIPAVALAPMAVRPEWQRRGIGSALVSRGLEICRERGKAAVMVLGHPAYYPRFGFSPELGRNLQGPFSGEAWMALELTPGALSGIQGTVRYPDAFGLA